MKENSQTEEYQRSKEETCKDRERKRACKGTHKLECVEGETCQNEKGKGVRRGTQYFLESTKGGTHQDME